MKDESKHISNLTIFAVSAAAVAGAVLVRQPDLGTGSIALGIGTVGAVPMSEPRQQADRMAVAQLEAFLERNGPRMHRPGARHSGAWQGGTASTTEMAVDWTTASG